MHIYTCPTFRFPYTLIPAVYLSWSYGRHYREFVIFFEPLQVSIYLDPGFTDNLFFFFSSLPLSSWWIMEAKKAYRFFLDLYPGTVHMPYGAHGIESVEPRHYGIFPNGLIQDFSICFEWRHSIAWKALWPYSMAVESKDSTWRWKEAHSSPEQTI